MGPTSAHSIEPGSDVIGFGLRFVGQTQVSRNRVIPSNSKSTLVERGPIETDPTSLELAQNMLEPDEGDPGGDGSLRH